MSNLAVLLALIAFAPAVAAEATATRLDGTRVAGRLQGWNNGQVVLETAEAATAIPSKELLFLRCEPAPSGDASQPAAAAELELVDGTRLPMESFQSSAGRASVALAAARSIDEKRLALPRKQIAAVRLQPLSASTAKQWQEIRAINFPSDVLVLLKRDGQSLDYVEGVLGDVSDDKIEFTLDGDILRIDRAKVAGFLLYRSGQKPQVEPHCLVHGRGGLHAMASHVELVNNLLTITTVGGVQLNWPLEDIHLADYSAGKLVYLSDLDPISEKWTPLVGLPADATLAAEYGRPRRDQAAYGGPLMLPSHDSLAATPESQTQTFNKGLALRSRTELVLRLPAGFRRFAALAGIDPSTSASGNVRLEIYGDDRLLYGDAIAGFDPPRAIDLDVGGVKRLKILVDYGSNLDSGDWLNLCNARLLK